MITVIMLSSQGFGLQCHASLEVEVFRFVKTSKSSDPRIINQSVLKIQEVVSKSVKSVLQFSHPTFVSTWSWGQLDE